MDWGLAGVAGISTLLHAGGTLVYPPLGTPIGLMIPTVSRNGYFYSFYYLFSDTSL